MVALVLDEGGRGGAELLEHVGDGCGRDTEAGGQGGAGHAALLGTAEGEDGLEVVVDGFGTGCGVATGGHGRALLKQFDTFADLGEPKLLG